MTSTPSQHTSPRRLGLLIVGLGGAVGSTVAAGLALLRAGQIDTTGLPLAGLEPHVASQLAAYGDIVVGGWDVHSQNVHAAATQHAVLSEKQLDAVRDELATIHPWPATRDIAEVRQQIAAFKAQHQLDAIAMVHLSSTEPAVDEQLPSLATADGFEQAVAAEDGYLPYAALYAYAAILEGVGHVNFTPSQATDLPALRHLAERHGVPLAGKDGKTGQTLIKTVLAPAFRDRNLDVLGWFSTNLLGNADGATLRDPGSLASKLHAKGGVLHSILGKPPANHQVHIHYHPPRGDAKEAWDAIDLMGFAGGVMQLKINFQCRDSVLAAPLAIELARCIDLAQRRGMRGEVRELACFFKSPQGPDPVHDFPAAQRMLEQWLRAS